MFEFFVPKLEEIFKDNNLGQKGVFGEVCFAETLKTVIFYATPPLRSALHLRLLRSHGRSVYDCAKKTQA